ncbi:MAG: ribosome silencing factor [Proteobacteria bacterium]|nr:ribosome silencing factor [Pseudomonadota bacterium]
MSPKPSRTIARTIKVKAPQTLAPSALVAVIEQCLDDDKAHDIISIPLAGKSTIADYMVLASGKSGRQLMAMADHLITKLKQCRVKVLGSEGARGGNWILIDAGDVIIHLFRPEVRAFYQIEKMWLTPHSLAKP